jgi:uncharacterized coiled-coil protein SlyX
MAFTVDDFQDLLRLLEQRPEWRSELRRYVLTDDLVELPSLVRALAEAQARTEQRMGELAQAQARTEQRVEELAQAQRGTEQRMGELAAAVESLVSRVGPLHGDALELRYWRRAAAYFSRLARKLRVVDSSDLAEMLDEAVDAGHLTGAERDAILAADLVLSGQRREDRADAYFVVEISVGIGVADVTRAAERASLLAKLGRPAVPVVAGEWINSEAIAAARSYQVWQVLDGRTSPPGET